MTHLPALARDALPVAMAPDLDYALASLSNAMAGGRTLPADRRLPPALHERLKNRANELAGWLSPPDLARIRMYIGPLLIALPGQGSKGSPEDADWIQKLYTRALDGVPEFALRAACAKALTHGVGGKKFVPSPAELRAEADEKANPWRLEAQKIRKVLDAKLEAPRPSQEVRRASAAAARQAFRIPPDGLTSGQGSHRPAGDGSLGEVATRVVKSASIGGCHRNQRVASGAACPDDRFGDRLHEDGEVARTSISERQLAKLSGELAQASPELRSPSI